MLENPCMLEYRKVTISNRYGQPAGKIGEFMQKVVIENEISIDQNVTWVVTERGNTRARDSLTNLAYILQEQFPGIAKEPKRLRITIEEV